MSKPFVSNTKAAGPCVREFLAANGPHTTNELHQMFGSDVSVNAFHHRLKRMRGAGFIEYQDSSWAAGRAAAKRANGQTGLVAPPRSYDLMRAVVWVPTVMQTARLEAIGHAELYASKRGDEMVPHRVPMHMCSGLKGGMQ